MTRPAACCGCRCSSCRRCPRRGRAHLAGGVPLARVRRARQGTSGRSACAAVRGGPGRSRSAPPRGGEAGGRRGAVARPTRGASSGWTTATASSGRWSSAAGGEELVFVTSDAQLLRFPAASVRPQGRPAGGMAGVRLSTASAWSCSGRSTPARRGRGHRRRHPAALPGTAAGSVKVTPLAEYPGKGRATGGVRCQRFLKGEDRLLVLAGRRPAPARAAPPAGPARCPPSTRAATGRGAPGRPRRRRSPVGW